MNRQVKFDKMETPEILDFIFRKFAQHPAAHEICACVAEEFRELQTEYPLHSDQDLISMIVRDCPDLYNTLCKFSARSNIEYRRTPKQAFW